MHAQVGDWLVVKGAVVDRPGQRGLITEVRSADGRPPYVVRWLGNDQETLVFPGPDAIVVTAAEQRAADEEAQQRIGRIQSEIAHHPKPE